MRAPDNPERQIDDYLHQSRYRGLGGSGNIWGGKCVPLDESDFARRDWIEDSGWPVSRAQMQPYYDRACRLFEIPAFNRDYDRPAPGRTARRSCPARAISSPRRATFTRLSGIVDAPAFDRFRTGFAEAREHQRLSPRQRRGDARGGGARCVRFRIACLNGRRHTARGRAYVLATGGIENVRLLLASEPTRRARE